MLKMRLELLGDFEVLAAENGEKGCEMAATEQPDIVLMDLEMPVVDGWEATRRLRDNPQTRDIPIIALSAHALAGEREKALAAGCNEFDTTPVKFDRLVATVRRLLASHPSDMEHSQPSWLQRQADVRYEEPLVHHVTRGAAVRALSPENHHVCACGVQRSIEPAIMLCLPRGKSVIRLEAPELSWLNVRPTTPIQNNSGLPQGPATGSVVGLTVRRTDWDSPCPACDGANSSSCLAAVRQRLGRWRRARSRAIACGWSVCCWPWRRMIRKRNCGSKRLRPDCGSWAGRRGATFAWSTAGRSATPPSCASRQPSWSASRRT